MPIYNPTSILVRCEGKILRRNQVHQVTKKIEGSMVKVNFIVFYDIDGAEAKTVLRLADYDGEDEGAWVLLEAL